ncbi:MAG TPA: twin-arginine translocase TatA/TatE family subunit [Nitrospirota bacterium]|nr:twin-arginine translocase TatA/TatE family subunit [Nitrospirota bacterium]
MFEGIFQPLHLLLILGIVLIIFGPGKLPELGEGLGKSIKSFKKAMKEEQEELTPAHGQQIPDCRTAHRSDLPSGD